VRLVDPDSRGEETVCNLNTGANDSGQVEILDFPVVVESLAEGHAPEFTPFFLVENVLGIPKKALVKAYVSAKVEFFELVTRLSEGRGTRFCKSFPSLPK
jgi:hypothetical protein